MLKASALFAVTNEERERKDDPLSVLAGPAQNIVIESESDDAVPEAVLSLAYRVMVHDEIMRDLVNDLRALFVKKREDFHLSLAGRSLREKETIQALFQDMVGLVSTFHYDAESDSLNGKLILSSKAQMFMTGKYLEMALYQQAKDILRDLAAEHGKPYQLYHNVKVSSREGRLKNEFDLVVDFDGMIYVIEVKSGKNFRDYGKYIQVGREYGIVPDRFLLVANYLSDTQAETAEYFCDYYVANLRNNSFKKKLTAMIEKDL